MVSGPQWSSRSFDAYAATASAKASAAPRSKNSCRQKPDAGPQCSRHSERIVQRPHSMTTLRRALGTFLFLTAGGCHAADRDSGSVFSDPKAVALIECISRNSGELSSECQAYIGAVNSIGQENQTPMYWMLRHNSLSPNGVRDLIRAGANPFIFGKKLGETSATYIVAEKNIEFLSSLLDSGIDINHYDNNIGWASSIIHTAIIHWDDAKIDLLVHRGANLEIKDNSGNTPLLMTRFAVGEKSSYYRQLFLLTRGASPYARNTKGEDICAGIAAPDALNQPDKEKDRSELLAYLAAKFRIKCRL